MKTMASVFGPIWNTTKPSTSSEKIHYKIDPDKCYDWLTRDNKDTKKDNEDDSGDFKDIVLPKALDGGWGWFVVLGAFGVSVICDGISYSFGVLYYELLNHYNENRSKTSFVGSVFFGVSMVVGPVSSMLTSRFGARTMTIVGGLTSSLGMLLSMIAPSLDVLFVTFGVIVGIGFSFCFNASIVIVSFYFEKKRSLATGIAVCGTGLGTVTFAPFMDYLINTYSLAGFFLVLSGVSLNLVVCGMLFRPLHFTKLERRARMLSTFDKIPYDRRDLEMPENIFGNGDEENDTMSLVGLPEFAPTLLKRHHSVALMKALHKGKNPDLTLKRYMSNVMFQIINLKDKENQEGTSVDAVHYKHLSVFSPRMLLVGLESEIIFNPKTSSSETYFAPSLTSIRRGSVYIAQGHTLMHSLSTSQRRQSQHKRPSLRRPSLNPSVIDSAHAKPRRNYQLLKSYSETNVHDTKQQASSQKNSLTLNLPLYRTDIFFRRLNLSCNVGTSCPQLYVNDIYERQHDVSSLKWFSQKVRRFFNSLVDCSLFRERFFVVFLMSNFFYYFWSDVPYMYATDHATYVGVGPDKGALIISFVGAANFMGQIVFGFIGDMKVNLLLVYAVSSTLSGVFISCVPLSSSYTIMVICYVFFGFFIAVSYPLTTVILVQYLGLGKLSRAYGLLMLTQGVGNFVGPIVSGWIADTTGGYALTFYTSGAFYSLSGLVLFMVYIPKC
ncbi:monocarboxylate transporter 9 [Biomphalaria glabrata]|uniref:Monocarboxylate transporter 9-like n=1 Tax=Biomphalaria glabrata TaxID=6526 RepID=A0A9U8DY99_BIOGL|nr:monocarboxylate transporter 9-like [Biomphalaria glabrata]XP_055876576.1 monocarboxylate transporter 9-like [Biomphalaria glabrata]KAI8765383.1 monocarboxylate transporter 9-like [Biomphalaria glabrata]